MAEAERLGQQYARLQDTVALEVRLAHTVLSASLEVRGAVVYGSFTVMLVIMPVFSTSKCCVRPSAAA